MGLIGLICVAVGDRQLLTLSREAKLWRDLVDSIHPDSEVVDQAIFEAVDPSVDLEALTAVPGILDGGGTAQRFYLVRNVQFTERVRFRFWVGDCIDSFMVPEVKILNFREPIIDQAMVGAGQGGLHPAAAVMPAHDNMFHL
jgi:hypothetical protein